MSIFPVVSQDPAAIRDGETEFAHLSRRAGSDWDRVRRMIEEWCSHLDLAVWKDTIGNLKSDRSREFRSAFWELYLGAVFRRLGFEIEHHVPVGPDKQTAPDFRLRRGSSTVFVEATSIDEEPEVREAQLHVGPLLKTINEDDRIRGSNFLLDYDPIRTSRRTPPLRSLRDEIAEWLADLNPTSVHRRWVPLHEECRKDQGCFDWRHGDWHMRFFAIPRRPEVCGVRLDRVTGWPNPGDAWLRRDALDIKEVLESKGKKYGSECRPYVIAVMSPRTTKQHEIASALFGSGDPTSEKRREVCGFWLDQECPRRRNVSAVITAVGLTPYNTANVELDLWFNPWADHQLGDSLPFRAHRVDLATGTFNPPVQPEQPTRSILRLWEDWPKVEGEELSPGQAR